MDWDDFFAGIGTTLFIIATIFLISSNKDDIAKINEFNKSNTKITIEYKYDTEKDKYTFTTNVVDKLEKSGLCVSNISTSKIKDCNFIKIVSVKDK